jgi:hypothetical protein
MLSLIGCQLLKEIDRTENHNLRSFLYTIAGGQENPDGAEQLFWLRSIGKIAGDHNE